MIEHEWASTPPRPTKSIVDPSLQSRRDEYVEEFGSLSASEAYVGELELTPGGSHPHLWVFPPEILRVDLPRGVVGASAPLHPVAIARWSPRPADESALLALAHGMIAAGLSSEAHADSEAAKMCFKASSAFAFYEETLGGQTDSFFGASGAAMSISPENVGLLGKIMFYLGHLYLVKGVSFRDPPGDVAAYARYARLAFDGLEAIRLPHDHFAEASFSMVYDMAHILEVGLVGAGARQTLEHHEACALFGNAVEVTDKALSFHIENKSPARYVSWLKEIRGVMEALQRESRDLASAVRMTVPTFTVGLLNHRLESSSAPKSLPLPNSSCAYPPVK